MSIYGLLDPRTGKVRYVGHSKDVPGRVAWHWKKRNHKQRTRENPAFCAWLQGFLLPPDFRVLATVPYGQRYQAERDWTIRLSKTCDLLNISYGAAPLHRPWMAERNRRRGGSPSPAVAA